MVEYELFAFHEVLPSPLLVDELLEEVGYAQQPTLIFEDSKALVDLIRRGVLLRKRFTFKKDYRIPSAYSGYIYKRYRQLCRRLRSEMEHDPSMSDEVFARLYADVYMDC